MTTIIDFIEDKDRTYLLVKPSSDYTLKATMKQKFNKGCTVDFARRTIKSLAEILDRMHSKGVIHRSICAENVIMQPSKR